MDFSWLWVVPVLGVLIVVHEMGHFFSAIWLGIKVEEFGIGFPPRIFAIRRNGIDYSLNLLPIGGFVKITGENGDSEDPRSFGRAPAWKRIIVLAAGSFMNLLLALVIFTSMSVAGTQEIDAPQTAVASVLADHSAAIAGVQPGDSIVSIAGQRITSADQLRNLSQANLNKPTQFVVERAGKQVTLTITPKGNPPLGVGLSYFVPQAKISSVKTGSIADKTGLQVGDTIASVNGTAVDNVTQALYLLSQGTGVQHVVIQRNGSNTVPLSLDLGSWSPSSSQSIAAYLGIAMYYPSHMVYYTPLQALGQALSNTWAVISSIPAGIAQAVAGGANGAGVTSIVGISQLTGEVADQAGFNGLLNLTALLGISLFMINLLPLPALDGGRLLFILIELLRGGRRIAPEKEAVVHFAGMMVLLGLMALITYFDVQRLLEGQSLLK